MKISEKDRVVLGKILDEIKSIESNIAGYTFEKFMETDILKRGIAMTLINIGELARHISKEFRDAAKEMPIKSMIAMRDVAAHGYLTLKFFNVWETIQKDIPDLKTKVEKLINVGRIGL